MKTAAAPAPRTVAALLFAASLGVFLIGFRYVRSGDTYPNELLPVSILREGNLDLNEFGPPWGENPYWVRLRGTRFISSYPIIPGVLNTPVYAAAALFGVDIRDELETLSLLSASILSALSVSFLYLVLRRLLVRPWDALLFAALYALATPVWSVACRGMWQHGPSLFLITLALLHVLTGGRRGAVVSGLALGFAVFNRPMNALVALPLAVFVGIRNRRDLPLLLGASAVPAVLLGWYSASYWGSVLALGQQHGISGFSGHVVSGIAGLLFSPARGLLVHSPVFLLACVSLVLTLREHDFSRLEFFLAVSIVLQILVTSGWENWWGGHSFGYRLLIETVPALTILLARAWERFVARRRLLTASFALLALLSVCVHFLGAFYYPSGFNWDPNLIDQHPERLWRIRGTEILRCSDRFRAALTSAAE
jgi:hypothetical protein